ncbi:type IV pilin protein [Pseudomonas sp. EpS/L25]|uniref:type IV pilin protein n=1 Tax=Pseudomonas sp. EpS/L25 TaxID=1749078 RepID=UPI000743D9D6|nr:type IV pilin protein [Pseudomonas sp. EpS/L25]KUM39889.1 pilus assembly protein PilE [Pseudomonas sp. EpS/L25]
MSSTRGFTLIEVMITVAIVGILAAIAYPSYQSYILRSHRSEGMALLSEAAARMERYYAQNSTYATATPNRLGLTSTANATTVDSANGYYSLSLTTLTATSYSLSATPQNAQARDTCGTLTLDSTGLRGAAGKTATNDAATVSNCWR